MRRDLGADPGDRWGSGNTPNMRWVFLTSNVKRLIFFCRQRQRCRRLHLLAVNKKKSVWDLYFSLRLHFWRICEEGWEREVEGERKEKCFRQSHAREPICQHITGKDKQSYSQWPWMCENNCPMTFLSRWKSSDLGAGVIIRGFSVVWQCNLVPQRTECISHSSSLPFSHVSFFYLSIISSLSLSVSSQNSFFPGSFLSA